jgi:hypothetical protein
MSEQQQEAAPVPPSAPSDASPLAALTRSLRLIKVWLAVLTVAVAAFAVTVVVLEVVRDDPDDPDYAADMYQPSEQQVAEARADVENAFGDRLESVDVRIVQVDLPEEALAGAPDDAGPPPTLYVEYRLRGFETPIAGTLTDPYTSVASSGLVPTKGSLVSRMTDEQFDALLVAYAKATPSPLGGVRRYGDSPMEMPGQVVADTIKSGGRSYRTDELWSAREGALVKGDHMSLDDSAYTEGTAHVFHEDPKSGEFTYLGTESGVWW